MAALSASTSGLLRLLTPSCGRRQAAAATLSSAAVASKTTASGILRSQACRRAPHAIRHLAAVPGATVVCSAADDGLVEVQLKVDGMVCEGCSSRVEEALQKMAGVKKVHVDLEKGLATVQVEADSQLDALNAVQPLAEAVKGLGFDAEPHFA